MFLQYSVLCGTLTGLLNQGFVALVALVARALVSRFHCIPQNS